MGVPNFYSWLKKRFPLSVYDFAPNHGHKTDFLYMDMNQVIYKCAMQPNILFRDQIAEKCFTEVWVSIFNYIDRIISLVQPTKLIFLTFDGVAPRAKMNQQRQRRFQSAKRAAKIDQMLQQIGEIDRNETVKNNQISPGTEFMFALNEQVRFFIQQKLQEDPKWRNVKVIFSGSDVPGEGEHKILEFIRNSMQEETFDQEWTHMIYGADADLIMLGLLTQLKSISIVREIMKTSQSNEISSATQRCPMETDFQLINLSMVREYMDQEYKELAPGMKIEYNVNRLIDDFILICFFIGNDFLPRVFCFDIRQGTLEDLLTLFKNHMLEANDYLTNRGQINWIEFTRLMKRLTNFEIVALEHRQEEIKEFFSSFKDDPSQYEDTKLKVLEELTLMEKLTAFYKKDEDVDARTYFYSSKCDFNLEKPQDLEKLQELIQKYIEGVQFVLFYYFQGVPSWGWYYPAYYAPLCSDMYIYLSHVLENDLTSELYAFEKGQPYNPFKQLLCILSPTNAPLLPQPYRTLLTSQDSPLRSPVDFYPEEFDIDPYGTIWEHQFIAKIPFLSDQLIDKVYKSVDTMALGVNIYSRNEHGSSQIFFFNKLQERIKVYSKQLSIYQDYESQQVVESFDIDDIQECKKLIIQNLMLNVGDIYQFKIPSILLNLADSSLEQLKDHGRKCNKIMIRHFPDVSAIVKQVLEAKKQRRGIMLDFRKELYAFCGYPIPRHCEILGIMSIQQLSLTYDYKASEIETLNYNDYSLHNHVSVFNKLKEGIMCAQRYKGLMHQFKENALDIQVHCLAIVKRSKQILRRGNGDLYQSRRFGLESVIPMEWIFEKQEVNLMDINNTLASKYMKENMRAIVLSHKDKSLIGSLVQVLSINNEEVQVELIRQVAIKKLKSQKDTIDTYTIGFVADQCLTTVNVLLYVLGKVQVNLDQNLDSFKDLVPAIDIGLNVIDRAKNKLVPELCRIHQADSTAKGVDKYAQFKYLELSRECVNIIGQYRQKCPNLFSFLERIIMRDRNLKNVPKIKATDLFPNAKDANIALIEVYIWLSKQPSSNYLLSSSASSVIPAQKIKDMQEQIIQVESPTSSRQFIVESAYLLPYSEHHFVPPYYNDHPTIHQLRDRVVCINATDYGLPVFGTYGTVVGIIDASDEILNEVVWDEPQIGLNTLGSRCSYLRGSICRFIDIYNLTQDWTKFLSKQNNGWDYQTTLYQPQFKTQAIDKAQHQPRDNDPFVIIKDLNRQQDTNQDRQKVVLVNAKIQETQQLISFETTFDELAQSSFQDRQPTSHDDGVLSLDQVEKLQIVKKQTIYQTKIQITESSTIISPNQDNLRDDLSMVRQAFNLLASQGHIQQDLPENQLFQAKSLDDIEKFIEESHIQPKVPLKKVLQRPKKE